MSPKPLPLRTETMKIFDLRESRVSKAIRFWVGLASAALPLTAGLVIAKSWALAVDKGYQTHVDVLSRIGLPTLAAICFINLYSRSLQRLRWTPMLVSLSFLWLAAGETAVSIHSTLGFGNAESLHLEANRGIMVFLTFGTAILLALGSRAATQLSRAPTTIRRLGLAILGAGLLLPSALVEFGRGALESSAFVMPLSVISTVLYLYAAWRLFLSYRIEYEPLRLALVFFSLGGAASQSLFLLGDPHDAAATLVAVRATLLSASLAPLIVIVLKDIYFLARSLPAQVRLTFNLMTFTILVAVTIIVAGLGEGITGPNQDAAAAARLAAQQRSVLGLASIVLGITCGAMLLATLACRRFLDNVEGLVDATRKLAQGKLESLVQRRGNTELAALTGAFNAMAERVFLQTRELRILARVMDGTSDPVLVLDPRMHIVYANDAFTVKTGWARSAAIGRSFLDLFIGADAERKLGQIQEDIESGQTWAGELAVRTKAAGKLDSFVTVSPVVHEGKIIQCVAMHRDLSALKRLESERLAFADNLVRLHTVTQDLVRSLDVQEVPRRAISGLSQHFGIQSRFWMVGGGDRCSDCALASQCDSKDRGPCLELGTTGIRLPLNMGCAGKAADIKGRFVCYRPDEHPELFAHEPESLRLDGLRAAYPIIENDEVRAVLELGIPENEHGRVLESMNLLTEVLSQAMANARLHQQLRSQADYLQATTRDLKTVVESQSQQAEELREANVKLVEADRLRNTFLSTTSHELRTPISGMMGYLRLVIDGLAEDREEEMGFIRDAHNLAQELLEVINDVLTIAKIDSGQLTVNSEAIEVEELILEVASEHGETIRGRGLGFHVDDVAEGLIIHADHQRLLQVFGILISNAQKFSQDGEIRVEVDSDCSAGFMTFRISDKGIGLDASEFERVMEPFVQADAGDRREYGGSGLGLTLARDLLALMGGTIRLESEGKDCGVVATITLPIGAPIDDEAALGDSSGKGPVVVVADSDPQFIALVRDVVLKHDGRCQVAASAASAFDAIRDLRPDFVLSEFGLPHRAHPRLRTGVDLSREIENSVDLETRFILTTALDPTALPLATALRGCPEMQIAKKPLDESDLISLLNLVPAEVSLDESGKDVFRVLLVDDDLRTSERVLAALKGSNFRLDYAQRGDEAIASLSHAGEPYDVLLIDLLLPGMSLYEILDSISGRERFERLAIVVLVHNGEGVTGVHDLVSMNEMVAGAVPKSSLTTAPHLLARTMLEAIQKRQKRAVEA